MKIKCDKENAGTNINGIEFEPLDGGGMVSVGEVDQENAEIFLSIPGYSEFEPSEPGSGANYRNAFLGLAPSVDGDSAAIEAEAQADATTQESPDSESGESTPGWEGAVPVATETAPVEKKGPGRPRKE